MTGEASSVRARFERAQVSLERKRALGSRTSRPPRTAKPLSSAHGLSTERAATRPQTPQLRRALTDRRELMAAARDRAQSPLASARHLATSSMGKLVAMAVVLATACFLTGWYASSTLDTRTELLQDTLNHTEPLSEASQVLYSSLSIADAAANAAFISGGLEPPTLRQRYSDAIATASNALIIAASNSTGVAPTGNTAPTDPVHTDLGILAANIPVYTGIVETARTNNRLGNPVGSAYLGEASSLMQDTILPAAQRLYVRRSAEVANPQRALTQPPWGVYTMLIAVLIGLVFASRYLNRHTRRRFNIGVSIGILAMVVGLVWLLVAGLMSVAATNNAQNNGADPLRELTQARIETQQARSAQTLSLVRRDQDSLGVSYQEATESIARTLTQLKDERQSGGSTSVSPQMIERAIDARNGWDQANSEINRRIAGGDFPGARTLLVGNGLGSAAYYYSELDAALVEAITSARTVFRDDINTAQRVLGFSGSGIWTLGIIAALAVPLGLVPRIREYM